MSGPVLAVTPPTDRTPRNARQTSKGRVYSWQGENYWSVTTLIKGGLPAPALMAWGMRSVAEGAVDHYRRVYAMCEAAGGDPDALKAVVDWLKGIPYGKREKAADLGTAIHGWAEAYILGKPMPPEPADVLPYMDSFRSFLDDFHPEYVAEMAEASVYNRTESYAGTLDAIARIGDRMLLLDYKTSKDGKGPYPEAALQLVAYRRAEFVGLPDGTEHPMPKVDGCAVLQLRPQGPADPKGYDLIPAQSDEPVWKSFLFAREIFRWSDEISKGVLGQPIAGAPGVTFLFPEAA